MPSCRAEGQIYFVSNQFVSFTTLWIYQIKHTDDGRIGWMMGADQDWGGGSDTSEFIWSDWGKSRKTLVIQPRFESCVSGMYIILRQQYTVVAHRHSLLFLDFDLCLIFKNTTLRKSAVLPSSCKEATNLMDSLDRAILSHSASCKRPKRLVVLLRERIEAESASRNVVFLKIRRWTKSKKKI